MGERATALADLLGHLHGLANDKLSLWDLPKDASARLINVSENTTYLVEAPNGHRSVLRIHRDTYHTRRAIECELAWLDALRSDTNLTLPRYYRGRNGFPIQEACAPGLAVPRFMVLFEHLDGVAPDEAGDLGAGFSEIGAMAATCHLHAIAWRKPEAFERLTWDFDAVFGTSPTWGDWREGPEVDPGIRSDLEKVETTIRQRLSAYGKGPDRYDLIHADMRPANLLVDRSGTALIDFDDCGFGWFMYDFAAAVSFIEDDPRIQAYKAAWLAGYQSVRPLSAEDIAEIDTFIMLRRIALLAWIGSHIEAPEPQKLAVGFAATTARLGRAWLETLERG